MRRLARKKLGDRWGTKPLFICKMLNYNDGWQTPHPPTPRPERSSKLLTADRHSILLTLDGRLAGGLPRETSGALAVWPQALLMHAAEVKAVDPETYSFACVLEFLRNRSFVSLRAGDLVTMPEWWRLPQP